MKTIFMKTENHKTNESNKFSYYFTDKLNLKNQNKNIALVNLNICYTWKSIESAYSKNLKYLLQLGMINLNCLMDRILYLIYKIFWNTLFKKMIL